MVLHGAPTPHHPSRRASLPSHGRYPGRIRVSLPWPPDAPAMGPELVTRYLRPGLTEKVVGPPRFLGDPEVDVPRSQTPAGPRAPGHCGAAAWPSVTRTRRRLPRVC